MNAAQVLGTGRVGGDPEILPYVIKNRTCRTHRQWGQLISQETVADPGGGSEILTPSTAHEKNQAGIAQSVERLLGLTL